MPHSGRQNSGMAPKIPTPLCAALHDFVPMDMMDFNPYIISQDGFCKRNLDLELVDYKLIKREII